LDRRDSGGSQEGPEARTHYLEVLHEFALSQAELSSLDDIIWNIARTAIAKLGFEDCVVYLLDENEKYLIQVAAHGPKNPVANDILNPIKIAVGDGIVGAAAATGEVQRVADTRLDPRYIIDDEARSSELAVPIVHAGKVIGVLDSEHEEPGFYTDEHVQLFTTLASLASTRIDTALALERLESTVRRLKETEVRLAAQAMDLRQAKQEAEQAASIKSRFLANMSHEIRTPMTAIVGFSDLLTRSGVSDQQQREWSAQLKCNSDYLLALINSVLLISKIESGTLGIVKKPCAPGELLNSVVALMQPHAEAKGLDFKTVIEGRLPRTIRTDGVKFRQILINLLSNAIKYTEQGGVVLRVSCRTLAGTQSLELVMCVEDTGIGISKEAQQGLFDPFSRAHDERINREIEGSGLGLAIAAGYAGLLDASIGVESQPHNGSTFTVTLDAGPVNGATMLDAGKLLEPEGIEPDAGKLSANLTGCVSCCVKTVRRSPLW